MSSSYTPKFLELYHHVDGDTNYDSWIINIKALLRPKGLWACTQEPLLPIASQALKNKHNKSADMITHHISSGVKAKLTIDDFDDGYLILTGIKKIIILATEQTFFAFTQELFSLRLGYDNAENLDAFLTRIKLLNEKIESTIIEFTPDKRTLLVLMLGLSDQYESLVRIWATMPDLTADRAIEMLRADVQREEDRERIKYGHTFAVGNGYDKGENTGMVAVGNKRLARPCGTCGKHPAGIECWAYITCGFCKRKGHLEARCFDKERLSRPGLTAAVATKDVGAVCFGREDIGERVEGGIVEVSSEGVYDFKL